MHYHNPMKRKYYILLFTSLFFFSCFHVAFADDLQDGLYSLKAQDYDTAYKKIFPLAQQGNALAQLFLATMHEKAGFLAFQELVAVYSFRPDYYVANRQKLLGSGGVWGILEGNLQAHLRFVLACNGHDIRPHLKDIAAPTLVIHAGQDVITGPRTTLPLEEGLPNSIGVTMKDVAHVVAGKEEKIAFCKILHDFLDTH